MASNSKSPGMLLRNAGIFNPVLVQAVGLCPVVAMATSVKSAALLAAVSAVIITLSELISSLFLKPIPRWIRIGIYIIIGGAIVSPLMILIERTNAPLFGSLGIYLPIMAVNSLNVLRCERFAVKISPTAALLDGITASVGYSAVLIVVGFIRELLGSGSIFGFKFFEGHTMSGLLLPFGGFLMLGFAGAALRALIAKFWPKYLDKKQPKPGSKRKREAKPERRAAAEIAAPIVPEFTADETPFSLEELTAFEEEPNTEETAQPAEAPEEPKQEEVVPEQVSEEPVAEEKPEEISQPAEEMSDAEENTADEAPTEAKEEPEQKEEPKPVYKELTLDDIDTVSQPDERPKKDIFADADDELEALMSRSIGDILVKPKKEENEE